MFFLRFRRVECFDVRDKDTTLIKLFGDNEFYDGYGAGILVDRKIIREKDKDIDCYVFFVDYDPSPVLAGKYILAERYGAEVLLARIPERIWNRLYGGIELVWRTRKTRQKTVVRTQQYHRNFLRSRFEKVY